MKSARQIFAENLKDLMHRNDVNQNKLSEELKISQPTISSWLNLKKYPRIDTIEKLSEYFNVNKSELTTDKANQTLSVNTVPIKTIPVVASISAGEPMFSEENVISKLYIGEPMIKKNGNQYFGLVIKGDSMNRELNEGDVVIVEKDAQIENGQMVVVRVNGDESTVKRVKFQDNHIILVPNSTNPIHTPQVFTSDDDIHFIGKVIGMNRTF